MVHIFLPSPQIKKARGLISIRKEKGVVPFKAFNQNSYYRWFFSQWRISKSISLKFFSKFYKNHSRLGPPLSHFPVNEIPHPSSISSAISLKIKPWKRGKGRTPEDQIRDRDSHSKPSEFGANIFDLNEWKQRARVQLDFRNEEFGARDFGFRAVELDFVQWGSSRWISEGDRGACKISFFGEARLSMGLGLLSATDGGAETAMVSGDLRVRWWYPQ